MKITMTGNKMQISDFDQVEGLPLLKRDITDSDLVLFDYGDEYSHVIVDGKKIFTQLSEISKDQNASKMIITFPGNDTLKNQINNACQLMKIKLPILEILEFSHLKQNVSTPALLNTTLTIPSDKIQKSLETAIEKNNLDVFLYYAKRNLIDNRNYEHPHFISFLKEKGGVEGCKNVLINAVKNNNQKTFDYLLNETILSEFKEHFLGQALVLAAECGHIDYIRSVLKHEEIGNSFLLDALKNAIKNNHIDIVDELLNMPFVKKFVTAAPSGTLVCAAEHGCLAVVDRLLSIEEVRANATVRDNEALRVAARNGHLAVVDRLLEIEAVKANAATRNNEALRVAAQNGHLSVVERLLEIEAVKAISAVWDNVALRVAAQNGHLAVVDRFLEIEAVKANSAAMYDAFISAARNGHIAIVEKLLEIEAVKADAATSNIAFLIGDVARNGHLAVVDRLLAIDAAKANAPENYNEALIEAARNGHLAVVERLLKIKAVEANAAAIGNAALIEAAENGHLAVVERLLEIEEVRANAAVRNNGALVEAATNGHLSVVERLLKIKAVNVNAPAWGNRALRGAAENGHLLVVERLLELEAINVAGLDDEAFKEVAKNGHVGVVEKLLAIEAINADAAAWDNEALRNAARNGHLAVVERLLKIKAVEENAAASNNQALREAAWNGHVGVVERLLRIEAVKAQATARNNGALVGAASSGHLGIVEKLLEIEAVRNTAHENNNQGLSNAAKQGHIDVVRALLTCPHVVENIAINNNAIFKDAAEVGRILVVKELLKYPQVALNAAVNDNYALRWAAQRGHTEVVNELLKLPIVRKHLSLSHLFDILIGTPLANGKEVSSLAEALILKHSFSKKTLLELTQKIESSYYGVQALPIELLIKYLRYYGYQPIESGLSGAECIKAIKQSIAESFSKKFASPSSHAGEILQQEAHVSELKKTNYEHLAGNHESAMEESLVSQAETRFLEKIKPEFLARFTAIEDIEKALLSLLLERKLSQLSSNKEQNHQAIQFIQDNKEALIARKPDVMVESRQFFASNSDTIDITWRALDKGAPSHGWEKLFVSPSAEKQNQTVFSTRASSSSALNLLETTNITRERLCYAYLVATDPELSPEQSEDLINKLIFYVAEISRAHNNNTQGTDNPSCFPGTITRLDLIFQAHPKFTVPYELHSVAREVASQFVVKAFNCALQDAATGEEKRSLFEAITLYSDWNAREIINHPQKVINTRGEVANLEMLLEIRRTFFESYFGSEAQDALAQINERLIDTYKLALDEESNIIVLTALSNMARATPVTTYSLTEAYQKVMPETKTALQVAINNPYSSKYEDMLLSMKNLVKNMPLAFQQNRAKKKYTENRLKSAEFDIIFKRLTQEVGIQVSGGLLARATQIVVQGRWNATMEKMPNASIEERVSELNNLTLSEIGESIQEALGILGEGINPDMFSFLNNKLEIAYPTEEVINAEIEGEKHETKAENHQVYKHVREESSNDERESKRKKIIQREAPPKHLCGVVKFEVGGQGRKRKNLVPLYEVTIKVAKVVTESQDQQPPNINNARSNLL